MPVVDRNILRLGAYELIWVDETPDAVVLDEMVQLAKEFSTDESPSFVNGLLGRLKDLKPTPAPRRAAPARAGPTEGPQRERCGPLRARPGRPAVRGTTGATPTKAAGVAGTLRFRPPRRYVSAQPRGGLSSPRGRPRAARPRPARPS